MRNQEYKYYEITSEEGRKEYVSLHESEIEPFMDENKDLNLLYKEIDVHVYNYKQEQKHGFDLGYDGPVEVGTGYGW